MNCQRIYLLTLLLLVISCAKPGDEVNKDVKALREKLPQLSTPLEYRSDRMYKFKAIELDSNSLITKLSEKNYFTLLGKVFETDNTISIMGYSSADGGTPVMITFDNFGKELSAKLLYENAMEDSVRSQINMVSVLPDGKILFTDSTVYKALNPTGPDGASDSVSVIHKTYRLSAEGLIVQEE